MDRAGRRIAGRAQGSLSDELTGLGGRPELRAAFAGLVASGAVGRDEVAYLALDLDRFKEVNDTFGHPVGDELLQRVARRIAHVAGSPEVVFRLGGDEFGVLLSCPKAEGATALAARLVDVIGRSFVIKGQEVQTGASVGVARVAPTASSIDAPYRDADVALYASKHSGRGQARLFEPRMARALEERRVIERDIKRAILLDQFELHYQPQLDLRTSTISGFEALIRWHHPERGMIPPSAFIPVAEENRFITEIGRWVLREACRTATSWPSNLSLAINVSSVQITDPQFLATVFRALQESGLAPERLTLEVTKSILLANKELVGATMAVLHKAGVKVSLDDFGVGCSWPGLLSQLPFDGVKFDWATRSAGIDEHVAVASVVSFYSKLGVQVVVGGIETADQLEAVRREGCHVGQGFLIGRPMPKGAVTSLLQNLDPTLQLPRSGAM